MSMVGLSDDLCVNEIALWYVTTIKMQRSATNLGDHWEFMLATTQK